MSTDARDYRIPTIDILRGLVIVIMALDHVRDYVMIGGIQDPAASASTDLPLFLTRWVTHFCAPVFVFLAGASAGLMSTRRTHAALGRFLLARGLWLVVMEATVVSLAWTFAPTGVAEFGGAVLVALGVIWAIGASMVALAALQWLGRRTCLVLALGIVLGHNLLDGVWPATTGMFDLTPPWWVGLHAQLSRVIGPFLVVNVYPLLPWLGVMLLGFGSSGVFDDVAARRDRRLLAWGAAATLAFLVIRATGVYGDPDPWRVQGVASTVIDFLNVTKYPPSLLFVLMTLGPAAMFCAVAGRLPAALARPLATFGRAPFAFYMAHLYLIHLVAMGLGVAQGFVPGAFLTFFAFFPKGYGVGLPGTYLIWVLVVLALYPLCAWVAGVKARRRDWWLSYL
ncbi:hypothetical protein TBR22_A04240 [Luteitalea sp. TBR-22]|uniref:DUF1624 domain-containing protein n=1 Tax=Luteitalea sp. TBR-22 TaxID=2802971 RepID=UPI001AF1C7F0|nr:heparan-alpha-glucosaminide N-acetyltransferase domain-containing protein [Luteitalea sp. TBR-22]BCS31224.1 hypothetical protein TBR22_A04240 [Luteitalea sp. TBR-22]